MSTKKLYRCDKLTYTMEPTYVVSYQILKNGRPYTVSYQATKRHNETKSNFEKRVYMTMVAKYGQPIAD